MRRGEGGGRGLTVEGEVRAKDDTAEIVEMETYGQKHANKHTYLHSKYFQSR